MNSSVVELLVGMVRLDSVGAPISGRPQAEQPLAEWLEAAARRFGLKTQRLEVAGRGFNLLITHEVNADAPWLLFESHMDTVGVEGMVGDPFSARIEEGKLFGRGACDTKGSGAAMLWALKRYACDPGPGNIALLFTIDEEIAKTGINAFVKNHLPQLAWRPAAAVVGEPTLLKPVVAHNGVVRWAIRTKGLATHSSDPSQGRSAISMMMKVLHLLEAQYIPSLSASHPLTGRAACSVNLIRGGTQINIIPADCVIEIDRRIVPGEDSRTVLPLVETMLNQLRAQHPQLEVSQEKPFIDPPLNPAGAEKFIDQVGRVLSECGLDGQPQGAPYGTDASNLSAVGIPSIVLGPGDIAQAHKAEEWISLEQLDKGVEVYLALMSSMIHV